MRRCVHACIHASMHHASMWPWMHASMHPCIHASMHGWMDGCMHACMHPCIHHPFAHAHARMLAHASDVADWWRAAAVAAQPRLLDLAEKPVVQQTLGPWMLEGKKSRLRLFVSDASNIHELSLLISFLCLILDAGTH